MSVHARIPGRYTRPASVSSACTARMCAATLEGPSQLERGNITALDARAARALRAAIDDAIHDVALRFNLAYSVGRPDATGAGCHYHVHLEVKAARRAMIAAR